MSFWSSLGDIIQKPQSGLAGLLLGTARDFGAPDLLHGYHDQATTPWSGLMEGLKTKDQIHPHQLLPQGDNVGSKIANTVADIGVDPLMLLGGAAKEGALGVRAAGLADKSFSAGKLEGSLAEKAPTMVARAARRLATGTLAAGDPMSGLGSAVIQGLVENKIADWAPKLFGAAIRSAPEIADSLADVPSAVKLNPAEFADSGVGSLVPRNVNFERITPDEVIPASQPGELLRKVLGPAPKAGLPDTFGDIPEMVGPQSLNPGSFTRPQAPLGLPSGEPLGLPPAEHSVSDMINQMYGKKGGKIGQDELANAFLSMLRSNGIK